MTTLSQAEFARRRGVSKMMVTKWKAKGLLAMTPEGKVDVEASEASLDTRPSEYRGGKVKGPTVQPGETPEEAAERIVIHEGVAPHDHAEAVRIKENFLAALRRLEFDIKSGAVVPIDDVVGLVIEQASRVRNKLLAIPTRVAPRAAVLRSADEVRALVESEIHLVLQELTLDGEGHVTLDDARSALRKRFG